MADFETHEHDVLIIGAGGAGLRAAIEAAAAGMRAGETQGVFKSKFGYHVIKKHGENDVSLENARERIRLVLEKTKFDAYINSLQNKYKVEVLDANFKYD